MASIFANLRLAEKERNFAIAWSYVNLADASLPLVVNENELKSVIQRLHAGDARISETFKAMVGDPLPKNYQYSNVNRLDLWSRQLKRAALWNATNMQVVLKFKLWTSVGFWLLLSLILAVILAENLLPDSCIKLDDGGEIHYPFVCIALLGFFGGAISAYRSVPEYVVETPSYQLIKLLTLLRMLLGAAGSFVVFISFSWLGTEELLDVLKKNVYAFIGIGITAGFSERMFLDALNRMAENLNIANVTKSSITAEPKGSGTPDAATEQQQQPAGAAEFAALSLSKQGEMINKLINENGDKLRTKFKNVKNIYLGEKLKGLGAINTKIDCITFSVEKKDPTITVGKIPEFIEYKFENKDYLIPTDITEATDAEELSSDLPSGANIFPRAPGTGVSRINSEPMGTIGFKAHKKKTDGTLEWYLVSCYHVLFNPELKAGDVEVLEGDKIIDSTIICPSKSDDGGDNDDDKIGDAHEGILSDELDIGLAKLKGKGSLRDKIFNLSVPSGSFTPTIEDKKNMIQLKMYGRRSGKLTGSIIGLNASPTISYGGGKIRIKMKGLILTSLDAQKGDSGACVLDSQNRIVGIVTGKDSEGTYLIPIDKCLAKYPLNIV